MSAPQQAEVSPLSPNGGFVDEKHAAQFQPTDEKHAISPADKAAYFPDDKIVTFDGPLPMTPISRDTPSIANTNNTNRGLLDGYSDVPCEERKSKPRWWRRYFIFIVIGAIVFFALIIGFVAGSVLAHHKTKESDSKSTTSTVIPNNTAASVASSGVFLVGKSTFVMQTFWQSSNGSMQYIMSLDGKTFQGTRNVTMTIAPKVGSPISSTAFTDITGLVYLSLFYISTTKEIAMVQLACAAGSSTCATTSNSILKTTNAPHEYTGLSAVTVSNAQDWRIFYHDNSSFLSQVEGNLSGFKTGERVGGTALNGSSIAAVNVNATTNNINVFYVDQLTQALTYQQFTEGAWTVGETVSDERVTSWNPHSGLGAAYSSGQDQLHVYYTGLDLGVYEFLGNNASSTDTEWDSQPGRNHIWAEADYVGADIAAVGWSDQVRFFQQSDKVRMVQGALSNTTWTEAFVI